jgi:uncharacterized protein
MKLKSLRLPLSHDAHPKGVTYVKSRFTERYGKMAEFEWDERNITHIAEHGVESHEAEEVITNDPMDLAITISNGEERIEQVGETSAGRIIRVITTLRNGNIRVITAIPLRTRWHARYFAMKETKNARDKNIP